MDQSNNRIPKLMTRKDAARYLASRYGISMSPLTLDTYASQGGGPKYVKFGRRAYYETADIDSWVSGRLSRKFASTSDELQHLMSRRHSRD